MRGYIDLLRPMNCGIVAIAIFIGAVVAVGPESLDERIFYIVMAIFAGLFFTGAGNSMNDFFDRDSDRINHPKRPIPSGRVSPSNALFFAAALFVLALIFGLLAGLLPILIVIVNLSVMVTYELWFKRSGMKGNIAISWLVASLFIFGGTAVYDGASITLQRVVWLGILAFFTTLGREIVKDIEDVTGDLDRKTLPKVIGVNKAGFIAALSFIIGVTLSPLPFTTNVLGTSYLGIVVLADGIFIYCAWFAAIKPNQVSRVAKYGMVVALIAFLIGGAM